MFNKNSAAASAPPRAQHQLPSVQLSASGHLGLTGPWTIRSQDVSAAGSKQMESHSRML